VRNKREVVDLPLLKILIRLYMRITFKSLLFHRQNNNKVTPLAIACTVKKTQVVDLKKISNPFKKVKMKRKVIALMGTALVAVTLIAVTACEKPVPPNGGGTTNPQDTIYPVNIPLIDYSLGGYCDWNRAEIKCDSLYLINSEEELLEFTICKENAIPTLINFTKYSLIYFRTVTPNPVESVTKQLLQISDNEYQLDIDIKWSIYTVLIVWEGMAVLIPKLPQNAVLKLNMTKSRIW
jgi:hypothetical protein